VIVTLTGAFKNAGDHLIGLRARALVREHADPDVLNINRKEITDRSYEQFAEARAVLLAGGPAYQREMYPGVYNLDLDRVESPVLAYGLGWKGKLGQQPEDFEFTPEALAFVQRIHADATRFSSARDQLTVEMLAAQGIKNVAMTGCPAWYDLAKIDTEYVFNPDPARIVVSAPAVPQAGLAEILKRIHKLYPRAEKLLAFNAGFRSTRSKKTATYTRWNYYLMAYARARGFKSVSFESSLDSFTDIMASADLHVGYRVHSHLFSLSQRIGSVLIAEDSRGVGQQQALGAAAEAVVTTEHSPSAQADAVAEFVESRGASASAAVAKMRETYPEMVRFLKQL
jgi:polysaccharide pyruvyl transferase WcaK-like protein